MKIEKLDRKPTAPRDSYAQIIRDLKPGQMIRVTTAQEWRRISGSITAVARDRKILITTQNDGDSDVLIFIKESPKKV